MAPITMLRNTLVEEGGSGVALDRAAYTASAQCVVLPLCLSSR